ncbi:MAG: chorismate mutase [Clostridiales bacterium]|nr:chorismate mutase [Clostridiales bacterium]
MSNLEEIRNEINKIDNQLVELFEKRMAIIIKVARDKIATNKPIYDQIREEKVVKRAIDKVENIELTEYVKSFFESIMEISKDYQKQLIPSTIHYVDNGNEQIQSVGFQGVFGSFSDSAVDQLYEEKIVRRNYKYFEDLFIAVSNDEVEEGVVPYENTSTGSVNDVLDLLREYNLFITSQIDVIINHCLLGVKGSKISDLVFVYSHPQALMQCEQYFKSNNEVLATPYSNTAVAARDVSIWDDVQKGAIASKKASKLYNLEILQENIQDIKINTTRFIVVKKILQVNKLASKTSFVFTASHKPGALFAILKTFYEYNINITRIESRPNIKRKFEYYFYLDIVGNIKEKKVKDALAIVKLNCGYYKLLGCYDIKGSEA